MLIARIATALALSSCALPPSSSSQPRSTEVRDVSSAAPAAQGEAPRAASSSAPSAADGSRAGTPTAKPVQTSVPAPVNAHKADSTLAPRALTKGEIEELRTRKQEAPARDADATDEPDPFDVAFDSASARMEAARGANEGLLAKGEKQAFIDALKAAAPRAGQDAAQTLVLGDALFVVAPAEAKALYAKANELAPNTAAALGSKARVLHREGQWAEAAKLYQKALALRPRNENLLRGLRADCLIQSGAADEALDEWQRCNPLQTRTELESALARIHQRRDRFAERGELRARALAGDLEALERLLLLDVSWTRNATQPDYPLSNREFVKEDLALAEAKMGKESRRFIELSFLVEGRLGSEPRPPGASGDAEPAAGPPDPNGMGLPPSRVEVAARKLGFMGFNKNARRYPESSVMAPAIYRLLFQDGDIVPTEWIQWFDAEIQKRARSEQGDIDAAVFLLELYNAAIERKFDGWDKLPEKRAEFEAYAWQRYKDARLAARLLERRANELKSDDPVLKEALVALPNDATVARLAFEAARREKSLSTELAAARVRAALANEDVMGAIPAFNDLRALRAQPR